MSNALPMPPSGVKLLTNSPYRKMLSTREISALYGKTQREVTEELARQRRAGHSVFTVPSDWRAAAVERIDRFLAQAGDSDSLSDLVKWSESVEAAARRARVENTVFSDA